MKNRVVGLNSRLNDDPELMLSPLFNQEAFNLFNNVLDTTSTPPAERTCPTLLYKKDGVQLKGDFTTM
ncbi:hypothetical protein ABIC37_005140 [Priestia megaterium]|uniref:hypothetical protein n=1 Tax=Priestia megaterium TaxID=1404 RepID=UPI0004725E6F|nr:hypothetical protein [Priestia megaterium]